MYYKTIIDGWDCRNKINYKPEQVIMLLEVIKENEKNNIIAKITSNCNLNCPYCYTRSTIKKHKPIMSLDIFEKILQNIVMYYDQAHLIFHGGEPLTVPTEWYKKALYLVDKYKKIMI